MLAVPSATSPSVTIIVLNYNGEAHLRACLPSLDALEYPAASVMVADNGSTDGSLAYVRRSHPRAQVVAFERNLGFAAGYNRAVAQAGTEYVALLNNDTRVAPHWLSALVDTVERHQVAAAAAAILDWDGSHIDFVGGLPTAIGHAWQMDYGETVERTPAGLTSVRSGHAYAERRLLFGCGGAVLIRRSAWMEAGGFDERYYAYFEDVDLGWRLNLLGHATVFAPQAITYHRLHGSYGAWASALKLRLYERNALATIFKNYGDEALGRVLPMAVALALARNLELAKVDGSRLQFGAEAPKTVGLPAPLVALLVALEDFARWLPQLRHSRAHVQASRRVPDADIFALLPHPLKLHDVSDAYRETAEALIRDFRVADLFGLPAPPVRVAVPALAMAPHDASRPVITAGSSPPRVSIVVLTASGPTHLPECLDSMGRHAWPADRTEVIVVDNGSSSDPTEVAARHYPGVRVVRTGRNLGFSGGNNAGARAATGDYLVFLNDDTRVAPSWIDELVGVAVRRRAASVGALMLDWTGARVDFAGGLVNLEGRGFALHYDEPVATIAPAEQPVLFACGGAVLFRRDAFESSGGWDEPTFAYYEDVEIGWRLWMLGHEVWLAPKAVVFHKHHGTSGPGHAARARAFERNGLRMIYALLEEEALRRVLPAALLMAADRALLGTPVSRGATGAAPQEATRGLPSLHAVTGPLRHALIQRGARKSLGVAGSLRKMGIGGVAGAVLDAGREMRAGMGAATARARYLIEDGPARTALEGRRERVPAATAAALLGIQDFLRMLPELSQRRAWLQARRRRRDAEIFERFGDKWTEAVPAVRNDLHAELRAGLLSVLLERQT
jgi:GT2 family glycosyltransferase